MSAGITAGRLQRLIATTLLPGFEGTRLPGWLATRLRGGLGGVCLFGENIESMQQLRTLTGAILEANPRAVIAIDEEGGDVTRLFFASGSPYPGNAVLGRWDDTRRTENVARAVGSALRQAGCTLNFAPDVDVNSNPLNPVIGVRSFGATAALVSEHSGAWVRGLQSQAVAACAKHFPGHGDTAQDSHLSLPVVDRSLDQLRERELRPFAAAIAAGCRTIMTSHILVPQLDAENPATLSRRILQGLLRDDLGFDGVIVSDALDMKGVSGITGIPEAAARALAAGCDLLCIGTGNTDAQLAEIEAAVLDAVRDGRLETARIADAAGRVVALADELAMERSAGAEPAPEPDDSFDPAAVARAFDVQPAAQRWRSAAGGHYTVLRMDTEANVAIGSAPWGPFAQASAEPDVPASAAFRSNRLIGCTALDRARPGSLDGERVLVIGRDNHRHAFISESIDALRAAGADALAVDMGWPSDDRRYADVATFGASRLVGRALLEWLNGEVS